ncbi:hypothetical protein ACGFNU_41305 [Spirillospora sp. NPDC048911]|uniref:hypothetical protein n=1 Tax=Spirillospora sp. NPDC048911 TaxID=3364527 RepID=UPI00371233D5
MDTFPRRLTVPGILALALLVLTGWAAAPARAAEPDWNMVAESIGEAGYYVDSSARYFKTDTQLDALRGAQDRSTPVFIAVLPAGVKPAVAIGKLQAAMRRKGTYVVLAGTSLQASSTALPKATVLTAYRQAVGGNKGKPDRALVAFIRQLDERKVGAQSNGRSTTGNQPTGKKGAPVPQQGAPLPDPAASPAKAAKKSDGGTPVLLFVVIGVVIVAAAGGAGFVLMRRRKTSGAPKPGGAPAVPANAAPGGPGTPGAPGAPGMPGAPGASDGPGTPSPAADKPVAGPGAAAPGPQAPGGGRHAGPGGPTA